MLGQTPTDSIINLDEVVLNGVRSIKATPVTNTLISRDSLQRTYQGFEVSNIINVTPNVTAHSDNGTPFGYTYFRIRGLDQTRINMTLNGVPLNEPEDQGVYFSNYPNFIDNIKSLEIQRGVGTSTNGVSSFAGSINFVSQDGNDENLELKTTYGSFNTYRGSFTYQTGLKKNLSLYTNISTYTTDGFKRNSGGVGHSLFLVGSYLTSDRKISVTGFTGISKNEMAWKPIAYSDILEDPETNYVENDADDDFQQTFIQVQHLERFNNYIKLNTSIFYNNLDGEFDYLTYDFGSEGQPNLFLDSHFFGLISNLNYSKGSETINFGVSSNFYQREHRYTFAETNTGFKNEYSAFVKVLKKYNDLSFYFDLQYRHTNFNYVGDVEMDKINWDFLNPRIGLSYEVNKANDLYVSIGQSKREPTRTDLFGGNDYLLPDTVLNTTPEQVIDYELGYKGRFNNLSLNANLFYMDFEDEITLSGGVSPNGVPLSRSVDNSFRTGLEIEMTYRISKTFTLGYTEAFTYSEIENNNEVFEPILTPRTVRNVTLRYDRNGFMVELITKYHGESYINLENTEITPNFTIFNTNMGYYNDKFSIILNVQNLTDTLYFTNGSMVGRDFGPADEPHYFVGNPLSFYLTTKINL